MAASWRCCGSSRWSGPYGRYRFWRWLGDFAVGAHRDTVVARVNEIVVSAYPLAQQIGWDIQHSHMIELLLEGLGASPWAYTTGEPGSTGYAILQFVEASGCRVPPVGRVPGGDRHQRVHPRWRCTRSSTRHRR